MEPQELFKGFESEEEWEAALTEQNEYLKEQYDVDLLEEEPFDVPSMNEQAREAADFMAGMANALKTGIKHDDARVRDSIHDHLQFMNEQGHAFTAADFAGQMKFFLSDDFHLRMLEEQQTGLAYYLYAAAEAYAQRRKGGEATAKNHDKEFYQEIGRKGGEATSESHDKEYYEEIGRKGGESRGNQNNND